MPVQRQLLPWPCARFATLLVISLAIVPRVAAQRENVMAMRRAEATRVGDYCGLAEEILASSIIVQRLGDAASARADALTICNADYERLSLLELTAAAPASFSEVARLHTREFVEGARRIVAAMSRFRATVSQPNVTDALATALGPQRYAAWIAVSSAWEWTADGASPDAAIKRLSKYERKLGPTSPRPNGGEVVVNSLAQNWLPGFRTSPLDGPSAWELVAAYAPAYVTRLEGRTTPISAAEFGLRHYLYGDGFGKSGLRGVFRPSYWSVGVLTAPSLNGALIYPWRGHERSGGFVAWGSIKFGYIKRERGSWMVTKQFQAIPFLF